MKYKVGEHARIIPTSTTDLLAASSIVKYKVVEHARIIPTSTADLLWKAQVL